MEDRFKEIKNEFDWGKKNLDLVDDDMEYLIEEVEKLRKQNLQLRTWKEAYEKTYHQLIEVEGKHAASAKANI